MHICNLTKPNECSVDWSFSSWTFQANNFYRFDKIWPNIDNYYEGYLMEAQHLNTCFGYFYPEL